ncbi:ATP-binding Cassette (ABC) Superfamily [Trachipleistophora hominis]|uniref:ATP-binding Cassette (ABC) Superfamily n=1 Tax=Trachipleistophora hominis TaxID=72359 RepID=L7JT74_TRAHO|nr:ATP-binding Cassette (ABC) Superfamily [Trachipleistophora hominis]
MDVDWRNIDIEVRNRNKRYNQKRIKLISDACGHAEQGLLAIIGPSGSGKSTLIKALAGRLAKDAASTGVVTLNGIERDIKTWTSVVGFVDQDDVIYKRLTARETVKYTAKFKLRDKNIDVDKKIDKLFERLGIAHIKNCKMTNLSGGERKRVMVAVELVSDPRLIFLDEPTSGLDSNSALKIIKLLKDLAMAGRTIIFTIHQPDDILTDEFDEILLLSQGRSVYLGKVAKCEEYLISKGFEKHKEETFSGFAMRVLDIEPGVYHETNETNELNIMANEVKDRFGFSQEEKVVRRSNDSYIYFKPKFRHIKLLLRRRCKLELGTKKNTIFTIILIFILSISLFLARYIAKNIWNREDKLMKVWKLSTADSRYTKVQQEYIKHRVMLIVSIFSGCSMALIPLEAGTAFGFEHVNVKREIAANNYSLASYYLSVLIFEYVRHLPFLIAYMIGMKIIFGEVMDLRSILTSCLIYTVSVVFYLLNGSVSRDSKRSAMIVLSGLTENVIPHYFYLAVCRYVSKYGKWLLIIYFYNLNPNHLLGYCPYVYYLAKFIDDYPEIVDANYTDPPVSSENDYRGLLREYKRLLIGFELPLRWNYIVCGFLLMFYVAFCVLRISFYLRPGYRMRLNK